MRWRIDLLTDSDLQMFARIRVPSELLDEAHIERVDDPTARELLSLNGRTGDLAGILFPYTNPIDDRVRAYRLRRDNPECEDDKPRNKYLRSFGDRPCLYFPPDCRHLLNNPSTPVIFVESEKAVLACTHWAQRTGRTNLFIGCGGCWGWRGRIGKKVNAQGWRIDETGPLPDFDLIDWESREVSILFDNNTSNNPDVRRARFELARELATRGAKAKLADLPLLPDVNGPDDALAIIDDRSFAEILDAARTTIEVAAKEAEATITELENDEAARSRPDQTHTFDALAQVDNDDQRELLIGRASKAFGRLLPKNTIREAVEKLRSKAALSRMVATAKAVQESKESTLRAVKVRPAELIRDLERFFADRAYLPEGGALLLAFWSLNTWTYELYDTVPYMSLESATPGCGKSTVVRLLTAVCCRAKAATSITEAVLFRFVHEAHPTFLIDEAETIEGRSDRADALRAIAQEGYKQGGQVARIEGDDRHVEWYDVFCPKLFAAIGGLSGALLERCHVLHMTKAPKGMTRKSTRKRQLQRDTKDLRAQLEAYAFQMGPALQRLYENEPDAGYWPDITDREAELWSPLLYHARLAGSELEERLLEVVQVFSGEKAEIQASEWRVAQTIALLEAIKKQTGEKFTPGDLLESLAAEESWTKPFADVKGTGDDAKAGRAAKVGYALRRFRLKGEKNSAGRMAYPRNEAIEIISAHVPGNPPKSPYPPSSKSPYPQTDENIGATEGTEGFAWGSSGNSKSAEKAPEAEYVCPDCGARFGSHIGLAQHQGTACPKVPR